MPEVVLILMWPPADGLGTTGSLQKLDSSGKASTLFSYRILRAWELTAEEVTENVGTMLLAPLTKDAKQRMPEIVQLMKDGLERHNADRKTRQMAWTAAYWSMGLMCGLDEAHAALGGDVLPIIQSSEHYLNALGLAFQAGYSSAQPEGRLQAGRSLILRQGTLRFGPSEQAAQFLESVGNFDEIDVLARRVMTAADWPTLLADKS